MNREERIIRNLNRIKERLNSELYESDQKAIDEAIAIVEIQICKRNIADNKNRWFICPNCKGVVVPFYDGRKIEWLNSERQVAENE